MKIRFNSHKKVGIQTRREPGPLRITRAIARVDDIGTFPNWGQLLVGVMKVMLNAHDK